MNQITFTSYPIKTLLLKEGLHIPNYQRPYKWGRKHIRHLFYDIREAMEKQSYQLGSVILHQNETHLDIVDGQQRLVSIALFLHAIGQLENYPGAQNLLQADYDSVSCQHAIDNVKEWQNLIAMISETSLDNFQNFLLEKCEVSVITMPRERLSEAFQLFDSQNNRGKSLAPHDLLKAYHLRTIPDAGEEVVAKWEELVDDDKIDLFDLFDKYLFRMRRWSQGETGLTYRRYGSYLRFTEAYVDDFKGVSIENEIQPYPYLEMYRRLTDLPTLMTMPILDGAPFFRFIEESHQKLIDFSRKIKIKIMDLPEEAQKILESKKGRYIRTYNLFANLCFLFMDRFGQDALDTEALEMIFIWSYYPRTKARAITDATLGNYAAGGKFQHHQNQKLYQILANATTPAQFLAKIDTNLLEHVTIQDIIEKEDGKW